jgi:hypothetical protein
MKKGAIIGVPIFLILFILGALVFFAAMMIIFPNLANSMIDLLLGFMTGFRGPAVTP